MLGLHSALLGYKPVNPIIKLMTGGFAVEPFNISVVQVYVTTSAQKECRKCT